jgi:FRG domain
VGRNRWRVERHERTAHAFLDVLSPTRGLLAGLDEPGEYIYRGHGSEAFKLIPSAFRGKRAPFSDRQRRPRRTNEVQLEAEIEHLWEFFRLADARGLRLPEDSQRLRNALGRCREPNFLEKVGAGEEAWPPDDLLSVLALAQHYGVPTRLLDWTRHPYTAAYFAAIDALKNGRDGRLAVWAFDHFPVDQGSIYDWLLERLRLVTAPAADIPNLFAQQGAFLLMRDKGVRLTSMFTPQPYDSIITQAAGFDLSTIFYKFTLPASESSELLRLLSMAGVDASTIWPGYDGVVRAIRERLLFPPLGSWPTSRSARLARAQYHVDLRKRSRNLD